MIFLAVFTCYCMTYGVPVGRLT